MDSTAIWITLALFVAFYVLIEYVGKGSLKGNREAFRHKCRKGTGEKLADKLLEEKGVQVEKVNKDSAFDDRFVYTRNQLQISKTGRESNLMVAVHAILREACRAVLYSESRGSQFIMYLVWDILKTATLIAVPLFFVGLIIRNNYVLFGCLISFFILGMYAVLLGRNEKKISAMCEEFAEREKLFDEAALTEYRKLNEVAEYAPLYGTINAIRQINVIIDILTRRKG